MTKQNLSFVDDNNNIKSECKILIIGLGLIGGSLAKAILKYTNVNKIYYCDIQGIEYTGLSFHDPKLKYDIIFLACPLQLYSNHRIRIIVHSHQNTIISDVGSVQSVIHTVISGLGIDNNVIGGHPIAGSEKSGFKNSNADLFKGKKFIYTIKEESEESQYTEIIKNIWKKIGAVDIECLEYKKHDNIYAKLSHIPQLLLFMYKDLESEHMDNEKLKQFSRIARSSINLWNNIFTWNISKIKDNLKLILENLDKLDKNEQIKLDDKLTDYPRTKFNSDFIREHIISFLLASIANEEELKYAGNGFKDTVSMLLSDKDFLQVIQDKKFKTEVIILKKVIANYLFQNKYHNGHCDIYYRLV